MSLLGTMLYTNCTHLFPVCYRSKYLLQSQSIKREYTSLAVSTDKAVSMDKTVINNVQYNAE